jgi:hypothetical protein
MSEPVLLNPAGAAVRPPSIESFFAVGSIFLFKTISGEHYLGKIAVSSPDGIVLHRPVLMGINEQNQPVFITPVMGFQGDYVFLNRSTISAVAKPQQNLENLYRQQTGSIVLASSTNVPLNG